MKVKEREYLSKLKSCSESSICEIHNSALSNNISMECKNPNIMLFSNLEKIEPSIKKTNTYILNWNNINKTNKNDFKNILIKIKRHRPDNVSSYEMRKIIKNTSIAKELEEIFILATKNNYFIDTKPKMIYHHPAGLDH